MDKQEADLRVRELGERLGIPQFALDEKNSAMLAIEGGHIVNVGYATASGTLELMVCLDAIQVTPAVMFDVLGANFAWQRSGGGTFAIDTKSEALVLQRRCSGAEAANGGLFAALEALVAAAQAWQQRLLAGGEEPAARQSQSATAIPSGMVRA